MFIALNDLDLIATYFELMIGFQQACSMFELFCMVKATAAIADLERESTISVSPRPSVMQSNRLSAIEEAKVTFININRRAKWARYTLFALFGIVVATFITQLIIFTKKSKTSTLKEPDKNLNIVLAILFAMAAICCITSLALLLITIQKSFKDGL